MVKITTVIKRDGSNEPYDITKINKVITKAFIETKEEVDVTEIRKMAIATEKLIDKETINVEEIQDIVESVIGKKHPKTAIAYAKYRTKREIARTKGWDLSDLGKRIYEGKYRYNNETFEQFLDRVSGGNRSIRKRILKKQFLFGGRILAGRGLQNKGRKITFSNCYVLPSPKDNIESIFQTAMEMARTFSYGGGVGIDLSLLRPKGMMVNNSAIHTTGAVSFMDLYSTVTSIIGQKGRRGALMISMNIDHPDIYDFIKVKDDMTKITSANISCKITDKFMKAVQDNDLWLLEFESIDTGERFEKEVHAVNLFNMLCKYNWSGAEPGMLFWDTINNWHMMSGDEDYVFVTTNPCGELPLIDYGACLLGSINLSAFVRNAFTKEADIDMLELINAVHDAVQALNEVLDENIPLHPLEGQREFAENYRPIGLGIMGEADMCLMLGIQYGSDKAIELSKQLGFLMLNEAVLKSVELAKEFGAFPKCNAETILNSEFIKSNIDPNIQALIKQYGIRNAQLMSIAPTGSLSTMLGVSGGIEPHYAIKYTRKVQSVGEGDEYYEVYVPVVEEFLKANPDLKESDIKIATNLAYIDRIKMQSAWQQFVDNAISSTINLPETATIDDVKDIYMKAWEYGLKGVTIYRDNCKRSGILTSGSKTAEVVDKTETCPECGGSITKTNGCNACMECGYSACSI